MVNIKPQLVESVLAAVAGSKKSHLTKTAAESIVNTIFAKIKSSVAEVGADGAVKIPSFGSFAVKTHSNVRSFDVKTQQLVTRSSVKRLSFSASQAFKNDVKNPNVEATQSTPQ